MYSMAIMLTIKPEHFVVWGLSDSSQEVGRGKCDVLKNKK